MWFLTPLALVALGALAGPVLIHLIQRERKRVVTFPSLMFLRRIPYQSVRRRRIRHWPLLLLRLAALALIVLAFARPVYERPAAAVQAASGPKEVVLLLDRSYSMSYGDRWTRARAAARRVVDALGPADRATLVLFATRAEVAVRSTTELSRLRAAIDTARPSAGATRFAPALKLAAGLLAASPLPRRELAIISDFQKRGWSQDETVRLPDRVAVTPIPVTDADPVNAAVSSVKLQRRRTGGQDRVVVSAAVTNSSARSVVGLPVSLELDGRTVETRTVGIEPGRAAVVEFAPAPVWTARPRGRVILGADPLETDNVFYFVVPPARPVVVQIVERAGTPREASFFVRQALGIGEAPRFDVRPATPDQALASDADETAVAILMDLPLTSGSPLTARLRNFLEHGGGVLVVFGERANWPEGSFGALPGRIGPLVDRPGRGGALATLDYGHPVFEPFKAPRSGEFGTARFFRYRRLDAAEVARVVARFDDGAPALVEAAVGEGRLLGWTSTLDRFWNDLALKPVFLPFVHQMVRYLAGYVEPVAWVTVEGIVEPSTLEWGPRGRGARRVLAARSPSGRHMTMGDAERALAVTEHGFYEVRLQGETDPLAVAVNVDTTESDLTSLDPTEFVATLTGRAGAAAASGGASEVPPSQERRELWWGVLLAGVALLAAEIVAANLLARAGPVG